MNRIFHARIAWYQYFLLIVLTVNAVGALWTKTILLAVLLMLFMIVLVEQIIHTTYTVTTDGKLLVYKGRFSRKKEINLTEISSVEQCRSMKLGRFSVTRYVLIGYGKGKFEAVMPVKEREFMELMAKKLEHREASDSKGEL